jgi:hypothetical protein
MEELIITMALSILLRVIKNPAHAAKFKAALLKLRDAINAAFPGEV